LRKVAALDSNDRLGAQALIDVAQGELNAEADEARESRDG